MTDVTIPISLHKDGKSKSHVYNLDNRVFIVNPVYRDNGESAKDILVKLMREDARVDNTTPRF